MVEGENIAKSPDGAVYQVESSLMDASDRTAAFITTVHQAPDGGSLGNFWVREQGETQRAIPERHIDAPLIP